MNKTEVQQRVLQNGKPLDLDKFSWDETTRTFSTIENNLILDFTGTEYFTFITGNHCTFITGDCCNFNTYSLCTFKTRKHCNFDTGNYCNFIIRGCGTFKTGKKCVCIREDVDEFFKIPEFTKIELYQHGFLTIQEKDQMQNYKNKLTDLQNQICILNDMFESIKNENKTFEYELQRLKKI